MKAQIPKDVLERLYREAEDGFGREVEISGGNTQTEITLFPSDLPGLYKQFNAIRITLNKHSKAIGHKLVPVAKKKRGTP